MKRFFCVIVLFLACKGLAWGLDGSPLASLRAIDGLSREQAQQGLLAAFEATVLFFRPYEQTLYVQDGGIALYIRANTDAALLPGDRVRIEGTTSMGFRPYVASTRIAVLRHGPLPQAQPASFDDLIAGRYDCQLVTVRGVIRTADLVSRTDVRDGNRPMQRSGRLQMLTDGGYIDIFVESSDGDALSRLMDDEVEVTGAASGSFDGKMQHTGVQLYVSTLSGIKVVKAAAASPWSLTPTPMDQIISAYHVRDLTQRVRVHGTITYYQPGTGVTLQDGNKSLWVASDTREPLGVGDVVDAVGFPDAHNGFLTLIHAEVRDTKVLAPLEPHPVRWTDLVSSGRIFDLVSIEGRVVTEVREAAQDEYVIMADGQLFSAVVRHEASLDVAPTAIAPLKQIPLQSKVRVSGICVLQDSNPFNSQVPFTILMRSFDDIQVVANPPWLSIRNLLLLAAILLAVALAGGLRSWNLERRLRLKSTALATRIEAEAALERRRGAILEDISSARPIDEILDAILSMVSFKLDGAPCWCQIDEETTVGKCPADAHRLRILREEIPGRTGAKLGALYAGLNAQTQLSADEAEALLAGAGLAGLAIETDRVYSDLVHRSEFDQLTDIHNRFALNRYLDECIEQAQKESSIFALVYIDLDDFKQINDLYGHHAGDLYLQEVARRMDRLLRPEDLLARLGGDEFALLLPNLSAPSIAEEVVQRLNLCFERPIVIGEERLYASISAGIAFFPADGRSRDELFHVADAAMYQSKQGKPERKKKEERRRLSQN
jgi:diguanylate cyclase (GGDEF)-like protein